MDQDKINKAIENISKMFPKMIVNNYSGFIIIACDERDFISKMSNIRRGHNKGFYTIEQALKCN